MVGITVFKYVRNGLSHFVQIIIPMCVIRVSICKKKWQEATLERRQEARGKRLGAIKIIKRAFYRGV